MPPALFARLEPEEEQETSYLALSVKILSLFSSIIAFYNKIFRRYGIGAAEECSIRASKPEITVREHLFVFVL